MINNSLLPIYYSKENFSSRFYDYSNVFFLPMVCFFGMISSILCIVGSLKKDDSKTQTFTFMLINSIVDFLFLLSQFFIFSFRCGVLCSFGYSYMTTFYKIEFFWFGGYALVNSQV